MANKRANGATMAHSTGVDIREQLEEGDVVTPTETLYDTSFQFEEKPKGQQFVIYRLKDNKKHGAVNIHGEGNIYNPESGEIELARLLTGVPTIWAKGQKDITPEYIKSHRRSIVFKNRVCRLPIQDKAAIQFLELGNDYFDNNNKSPYGGGKYGYYKWDPERIEREAYEKRIFKMEQLELAMQMPIDKVRKHALFLGVKFVDVMGQPRTDNGVRTEFLAKVEGDPARFKKIMDTKDVEIFCLLRKALSEGMIDLQRNRGEAHWSNGGKICTLASDAKHNSFKYLFELALTNSPEGRNFCQMLEEKVH